MRNADGPMSTPRRPPPRSSGTPMMWTGRHSPAHLQLDVPTCLRPTASRSWSSRASIVLNRGEEVAHLALLVDDVVREEQAARRRGAGAPGRRTACSRASRRRGTRSRTSPASFGISLNASPDTTVTMSARPARRMLSAAPWRAPDRTRWWSAGRRSGAARARSRSRCSRWRRRSRARASRRSSPTITRRKRPSSSDTASRSVSARLDLLQQARERPAGSDRRCASGVRPRRCDEHQERDDASQNRELSAHSAGPASRTATRRRQPCGHLSRRRAAVGDAVGNADAAEAAAGHEQARMARRAPARSRPSARDGRPRAARWRAPSGRRASAAARR